MRRSIPSILLFFVSLLSFSEGHAQDGTTAFAAGSESFAQGDYLRALAYFEDARDAGVQGPAVHYNIAVCHYWLEDYDEAEAALRLVAKRYPGMRALAEYNLGLVRLRQHRESDARLLFESARQRGTDQKVAELAAAALRVLDANDAHVEQAPRWYSVLDLSIGHDDNVALIEESSLPAGQSVESPFTEAFALVSGPLKPSAGLRFDGSVYAVRYEDAGQFDQMVMRLGGAYHWVQHAWRMEAESHVARTTLGGDGFEERLGVGLAARRSLSAATVLSLNVVHDEVDGAEAQFDYLEGARNQVGASIDRHGPKGRLTFAYQLEANDRASASVAPTRNRFSARYRYAAGTHWDADFGLSFRTSAYDELAVPRGEDLTELWLGFGRNFARGLRVYGTYQGSENDSDDELFSYTRSRIGLGLSKTF